MIFVWILLGITGLAVMAIAEFPLTTIVWLPRGTQFLCGILVVLTALVLIEIERIVRRIEP